MKAFFALVLCLLAFTSATYAEEWDTVMNVSISADLYEIKQGEVVTYTISVRNDGVQALSNISVTDSLPRGSSLLEILTSEASYTTKNRIIEVVIPQLEAGAEYSYDLVVKHERKGTLGTNAKVSLGEKLLAEEVIEIEVKTSKALDIKVTAFTPNGDGINDYFEIPGLEHYPNNELIVYNRFSDRVYYKKNYSNDWDGSGLPDGNYYYFLTITLDDGKVEKYNGFIAIRR